MTWVFVQSFTQDVMNTTAENKSITDALRYMNVPPASQTLELIETVRRAFGFLKKIVKPRIVFGRYYIDKKSENGIEVEGAYFESKDIARLTSRSGECYLLAATLGHETDKQILIAQKKNMLEGLALDACASVEIDSFIDSYIEKNIKPGLNEGEFLTSRFSPGYGDLNMNATEDIIRILRATEKTGLSVTRSMMMTPIKSVTAIIGLAKRK